MVIIDYVLAKGGNAKAASDLVKQLKGNVFCYAFLMILTDLKNKEKLVPNKVISLFED